MIKWISRWFNRPAPAPAATVAPAIVTAVAAAGEPTAEAFEPVDLPMLFYRALGAGATDPAPGTGDALILDELARLIASPQEGADLVPRVPAVIPQLLKSLRDDEVSGAELSRQLAQDVVLVAEVIREANSPYYSPATPVRTIEGAVLLLGQNGMRMLLARVAFRPIISMQTGRFASDGAPLIWRESESCALAASLLAPAMDANVFEAYLAGLLHHVGLIVALRLMDQMVTGPTLPASAAFVSALLPLARRLSASIAAAWEFPQSVSDAIIDAGCVPQMPQMPQMPPSPPSPQSPLATTVAAAERLAVLRVLADSGQLDLPTMQALAPAPPEQGIFEQLRAVA